MDATSRAHRGQAKLNKKLCEIGGFDSEDWSFPPKPKWMRWRTYSRAEAKFDHYEAILDLALSHWSRNSSATSNYVLI